MADLWNDSRRDAVARAFSDSGVRYADVSSASIIAMLDRYAEELAAAQRERCYESETTDDDDTLCFRDAQSSLEATVAVLEAGHPETPKNAHRLVGQLPEIEACRRIDGAPLPRDPKIRAEVLAVQGDLAKLRTALHAGRTTEVSEAQRLDTVAQSLGHQPLEADAAMLVALFAQKAGDLDTAAAAYRRALFAAEEAGSANIGGAVARNLALLEMFDNLRLDRARDWLDLSRSLHRRAGVPDGLTTAGLAAEAQHASARHDAKASVAWSERLLERPSAPPVLRMSALDSLAAGQAGLGDVDAACETYEEALELVAREVGEGHPFEIAVLSNYGLLLSGARRKDDAEELLRRAAEAAEATFGPSSPRTAELWLNRGINLQGTQQGAELLRRALKVLAAEYGEGHNKVEMVRVNLGMGLIAMGQLEQGLEHCEAAERLRPKDAGTEQRAHSANCRAVALLRLGRPEEALAILEPFVESGAEGANTRSVDSLASNYREAKAAIESE